MTKSKEIAELAAALSKAQKEMPAATKNATNPFFKSKYADLGSIMEAAIPVLTKNGLSVAQFVTNIDGNSALETILMHESGQYISSVMPLFLKTADPQGQGSAITYARRYALSAAIGMVADEDDDGNTAVKAHKEADAKPAFVRTDDTVTQPQLKKIAVMMKQSGKYRDIEDYEAKTGTDVSRMTKKEGTLLIEKLDDIIGQNVINQAREESPF